MVDSTGFISEQKHNRRASVIILAGTFFLLFVVANLVAGILGAYSNQDCKAVSAGGSFGTRQVCTTTYQVRPVVLGIIALVIVGYLAFAWLASSTAALTSASSPVSPSCVAQEGWWLSSLSPTSSPASVAPSPRRSLPIRSRWSPKRFGPKRIHWRSTAPA